LYFAGWGNIWYFGGREIIFMLPKGVYIEVMLRIKDFIKDHTWIMYIGLLTGGAIVLFRVISLLVIYRYLKLDYYLCLVAVCFGVAGWMLNKRRPAVETVPRMSSESREDLLTVLTSKEVLVLRLLAESKTNKEIAAELYVELSTVKTHVNNIYSKLSVSNRKEARSKYAEMAQRFPFS
jgi:DNA-binding CsgD family transcriptional regulator